MESIHIDQCRDTNENAEINRTNVAIIRKFSVIWREKTGMFRTNTVNCSVMLPISHFWGITRRAFVVLINKKVSHYNYDWELGFG